MYIIARIRQVDGDVRFVGARTRRDQREAQSILHADRAMIDYLGDLVAEVRDIRPGRRPAGWVD